MFEGVVSAGGTTLQLQMIIVPMLCVGMQFVTLCVTHLQSGNAAQGPYRIACNQRDYW
ncbi:hypothetical protein ALP63_200000 [Pseudomonas syringae pv. aceris]|nr:hypothetical protein ALP63_200000 [Pseudomonas syringae pv. aceris]